MQSRILSRAMALAAVALLLSTSAVWADDIYNNLDASIDASAEVMALNVGGANGSTQLWVQPRNGDGDNGCNFQGATEALVVSVGTSNSAAATVSPSSLTFDSCGDTPTLTVTPIGQGSATISLAITSNNTGGTFNLVPATFTVHVVPPANTAPQISISGVVGGASYEFGSVPAATCQVTDAEDGNFYFGATLSSLSGPLAAYGLGQQEASCSYTDGGGLATSASVTYWIIDTIAPTVSHFVAGAYYQGFEPWYTSATVTVTWSRDDTVGLATGVDCDPVVITEDVAGQELTCTVTDVAGNTASDTVTIYHDATAPTIIASRSAEPNANGWNNGPVTVSFACDDNLSGVLSTSVIADDITYETRCEAWDFVAETSGSVANGQVYDQAGNFASASEGPIKIDTTAPSISAALDRSPAGNGWFNASTGAPTVSFTCSDATSGLDGACPADYLFGEGEDQAHSQSISDLAGNSASAGVSNVDVDTTAPTASASRTPVANAFGWSKTNVTVHFDGSDATSGIHSCSEDQLFGEGAGQSASGTCIDAAGNVSAAAVLHDINVDKTNPVVSLVGGPADGGLYYYGFVPPAPTCSASDALSGLDGTCSVGGYSDAVGSHTVTASAADKAGNSASTSSNYTVNAWTLKGFYQPVDMNGVYNVVKGGSTVPLKFEVFAGTTELTSISVVKSFVSTQVACSTGAQIDDIELTTTGGTSLRYDSTGGQFIQNWQTPKTAGVCYRVTMTTQDASTLVAYFKLK